jgi:exonuclease III
MKLISFNYRGVASPSKKLSLKRLVDSNHPDIIFLQETLGTSYDVSTLLEALFLSWSFSSLDARGRSGGLALGWNKKMEIEFVGLRLLKLICGGFSVVNIHRSCSVGKS